MMLSNRPSAGEGIEQDRVHGLPHDRTRVEEKVEYEQPSRRHGERYRHQCHCASCSLNLRLSHDLQTIGDCFDSRIGSGAHRVCLQKNAEHSHQPQGTQTALKPMLYSTRHGGDLVYVHSDSADEEHGMCEKEQTEDRRRRSSVCSFSHMPCSSSAESECTYTRSPPWRVEYS